MSVIHNHPYLLLTDGLQKMAGSFRFDYHARIENQTNYIGTYRTDFDKICLNAMHNLFYGCIKLKPTHFSIFLRWLLGKNSVSLVIPSGGETVVQPIAVLSVVEVLVELH